MGRVRHCGPQQYAGRARVTYEPIFMAQLATTQEHPTDRFGGISVRKTCNRLKFSVREMSFRAFLINAFCFRRDKNDVSGTKIGSARIIFGKLIRPKVFGKWTNSGRLQFP